MFLPAPWRDAFFYVPTKGLNPTSPTFTGETGRFTLSLSLSKNIPPDLFKQVVASPPLFFPTDFFRPHRRGFARTYFSRREPLFA